MSDETQQNHHDLLQSLQAKDEVLISDLVSKSELVRSNPYFRNSQIEHAAGNLIDKDNFNALYDLLEQNKSFELNIEHRKWSDTDGEEKDVSILRAASTRMWPMGTHYWTRDNALIAARLLNYPNEKSKNFAAYRKAGKELLMSSLNIMSSQGQLKRFRSMIESKDRKFINAAVNWPHIFLAIEDNLNADKVEHWSHKQDAWQILAFYILQAIQDKVISVAELSLKNREFLGLLVPFLAKIDFYKSENSGSWEEIPAVRSSVICWDMLVINKVKELAEFKEFRFLTSYSRLYSNYLKVAYKKLALKDLCESLLTKGAEQILKMLPFEAGSYKKEHIKYREADAALIYLLQTDFCKLLRKIKNEAPGFEEDLENKILEQVLSLRDPKSGGIKRYQNDSYQRQGFFRSLTSHKLSELYGAPSGDASAHFAGRDKIVPRGSNAAWTHFVWQLCAWASRRYLTTREDKYLKLARELLNDGLRTITGFHEYSIQHNHGLEVFQVAPFLIPECIIYDVDGDGNEIRFPTPHTPLNWAVAEAIDAFGAFACMLEKLESEQSDKVA